VAEENQQPKHLLTIREICALYGLEVWTVRQRVRSGQLQAVKKPGANSKNSQWFIVDPGWNHVQLAESIKHKTNSFHVDDVHILMGCEVAMILGVTPRAVRYMAQDGRLGFARTGKYGRSHRRYCISDVRKMIAMKEKMTYQIKRPGRKKIRNAVLTWAQKRLEAPETNS
jgi:hypothetical protein